MGRGATRKHPMFELQPAAPGAPRVCIEWLDRNDEMAHPGPHGHRFLALAYFERGGGLQRVGSREWEVREGDLFVIAPGETHDVGGLGDAEGWLVEFSADAVESDGATSALLSWHANPLLSPFVRSSGAEVARFEVPKEDRPEWSRRLRRVASELRTKDSGYREAVGAHLALILVDVARLARDVVEGLRVREQPALAGVFRFIEEHYAEPI